MTTYITGLPKLFGVVPLTCDVAPTRTLAPVVVNVATSAVTSVPAGTVAAIAMRTAVAESLQKSLPMYGLEGDAILLHAIRTSVTADALRAMCPARIPAATATVALLHDVGKAIDPRDHVAFIVDEDICTRCALCVDRCPTGVIVLGKLAPITAEGDPHDRTNRHGYAYGVRF